jgi:uncharacterized protein YidB (DUF937 family)
MGLLDVLNGMQNGPRGHTDPNSKGGMSPITMAILALLAYKGIKHLGGGQQPAPGGNAPRLPGGNTTSANAGGGGLGDILGGMFNGPGGAAGGTGGGAGDLLKGGLGGLLAGGAAGSVLSGGLGGLLKQFQQNGQSDIADSWVSTGPNKDISESDLARSIGIGDIDKLSRHTGLSRDDLLAGLRRELPGVIDELTPNGRVPNADEFGRRV